MLRITSTPLFFLCCLLTIGFSEYGMAQNKRFTSPDDCQLDQAKQWYEEGALEKIEGIEACAKNPKSMSREKRLEALELLTESYLYRDKIGAADNIFKELLRVDPLYTPDTAGESYQSYDLIYLSKSYSRKPIFSMYFGGGTNFTMVEQLENYGTDNTSGVSDRETYLREFVLGANGSIGFEVSVWKNFDLAIDATFGFRTYAYADSMYIAANELNPTGQQVNSELGTRSGSPLLYSTLQFNENQFWIDVPLMVRYNIDAFKGFLPYVYVGIAGNFLIHAELDRAERTTEQEPINAGGEVVRPPTRPISLTPTAETSLRTMVNVSMVAGAGVKFRLGRNFLYADFRYTRMFLNSVNLQNRYNNNQLAFQYGHVDNDFRMDNYAITVGFVKAFYTPRKKRQHNPFVLDRKYNRWLERERNYIKRETDEDLRRELNSAIKEMERNKPSLIEDVQKGRTNAERVLTEKQRELEALKNKRVKVDVDVRYD